MEGREIRGKEEVVERENGDLVSDRKEEGDGGSEGERGGEREGKGERERERERESAVPQTPSAGAAKQCGSLYGRPISVTHS